MAEIFGTAASVLQVAEVGFSLATTLYKYATTARSAEKDIMKIARDVKLTSKVLQRTYQQIKADQQGDLCTEEALFDLEDALDGCREAFEELDGVLQKSMKADGKVGWGERLKWPLKQNKLEVLRANLEKLKTTLLLMLSVLTYGSKMQQQQRQTVKQEIKVELTLEKLQIQNLVQAKDDATKRYEELSAAFAKLEAKLDGTAVKLPNTGKAVDPNVVSFTAIPSVSPSFTAMHQDRCDHENQQKHPIHTGLQLCAAAVNELTLSIDAATKNWQAKQVLEHEPVGQCLQETTKAFDSLKQIKQSANQPGKLGRSPSPFLDTSARPNNHSLLDAKGGDDVPGCRGFVGEEEERRLLECTEEEQAEHENKILASNNPVPIVPILGTGPYAKQDYHMQLMLLERQDRKKREMARQEKEATVSSPEALPMHGSSIGNSAPSNSLVGEQAREYYDGQQLGSQQQQQRRVIKAPCAILETGGYQQQDYSMDMLLIEAEAKKKQRMARQEKEDMFPSSGTQPIQRGSSANSTSPENLHDPSALEEYYRSQFLLEQQNRKGRIIQAREEADNREEQFLRVQRTPPGGPMQRGSSANSTSPDTSNDEASALENYYMSLLLLEQQNRKRKIIAREEADNREKLLQIVQRTPPGGFAIPMNRNATFRADPLEQKNFGVPANMPPLPPLPPKNDFGFPANMSPLPPLPPTKNFGAPAHVRRPPPLPPITPANPTSFGPGSSGNGEPLRGEWGPPLDFGNDGQDVLNNFDFDTFLSTDENLDLDFDTALFVSADGDASPGVGMGVEAAPEGVDEFNEGGDDEDEEDDDVVKNLLQKWTKVGL